MLFPELQESRSALQLSAWVPPAQELSSLGFVKYNASSGSGSSGSGSSEISVSRLGKASTLPTQQQTAEDFNFSEQ